MVHSKIWLINYARLFELSDFKFESDVLKFFWNSNIEQIKRTVIMSHLITDEFNVAYVQTRLNAFYHKVIESIKKHKQIGKNLHYVKELENIEVKGIFEAYKHLHHEKKGVVNLFLKHEDKLRHYDIVKQSKIYDLKMLILLYYICSLILYVMFVYMVFLIYLLYN